ncbi:MAG: hypothetical protein HC818_00150 [Synechococcaceae cyanobacterium RM1_1_27]|nr:hypothetical protein [Synechococcaceae cyanobacterium RM1_1_27]
MDGLFGDLETTALQDNPYPYVGTRPPLLRQGGWGFNKALILGTGTMAVAVLLLWQGSRWWGMGPNPFTSKAVAPAVEDDQGSLVPGSRNQLPASELTESELTELNPKTALQSLTNRDGRLPTAQSSEQSSSAQPFSQASEEAGTPFAQEQPQPQVRAAVPTPPPQSLASPVVPPPIPILGAPAGIQLVGILRAPGDPVALMIANGQTHQAGIGAAVAEWQVMSIAPHSVVISNGSQSRVLQISSGGG